MVAWPPMKRLLAAAAATCALHVPAAESDAPLAVTLAARDSHEDCVRLGKGEERKYNWKADGPVDFDIHYHQGPKVVYALKRDGMRGDGGTFKAKVAQGYCWTWTARERAVKLEGRLEPKPVATPE